MNKNLLALLAFLTLFFHFSTYACHGGDVPPGSTPHAGDKSAIYCINEDSNGFCGFIWFQSAVNTYTPGKFIFKFKNTPSVFSNLNIDLWMSMGENHGHGSAPLKITQLTDDTFQIEEAYFLMIGEWLVRVQFSDGTKILELQIPVYVEQ